MSRHTLKDIEKRLQIENRHKKRAEQERQELEHNLKNHINVRYFKEPDTLATKFIVELVFNEFTTARKVKDVLVERLGDLFE